MCHVTSRDLRACLTQVIERHAHMKRAHHLSNVQMALQFLESRRASAYPLLPVKHISVVATIGSLCCPSKLTLHTYLYRLCAFEMAYTVADYYDLTVL